ncbi:LacI family DNA-binding transcriptional regulator [Lacticaseibacillus jixianensis]|uniref:LacI family DNA-binding transcriptional regulator n=1 Tax=Lacticaseibacillus jixianensis TaxID=2486012 RepID=A0ABW4BAQ5_9LACO|nr:LacI family DNA-binding transcriptional regulator [Lacticaseibacillus jixianensis]
MTNIRDIARLSGYSVATVSRVLNHRKYVSDAVRQRIESIIRELDYAPNDVARDLSRGKTMKIGVVLPVFVHPYYTVLTQSITQAAFAQGYQVSLLPSSYKPTLERRFLEQFKRQAFDGIIFTSHEMPLKALAAYQEFGPVVVCEDPGQLQIAAAFTDRQPSNEAAFTWIKQRGFKRVALMIPRAPRLSATARAIVAAYTTVFGQPPDPKLIWVGSMSNEDGQRAGTFLAKLKPDFIFTNSDDIAAGVMQSYLAQGLEPPVMMGQENQLTGRLMGMSTIDHHLEQVGQAAVDLATGAKSGRIKIASEFIARE